MRHPKFGRYGAPWDFNLRDVFRWCTLASKNCRHESASTAPFSLIFDPLPFIDIIYIQRMRHKIDRDAVIAFCKEIFGCAPPIIDFPIVELSANTIRVGGELLGRSSAEGFGPSIGADKVGQKKHDSTSLNQPPRSLSRPISHIMTCVRQNWPCLLVGPTASGRLHLSVGLLPHHLRDSMKFRSQNPQMLPIFLDVLSKRIQI